MCVCVCACVCYNEEEREILSCCWVSPLFFALFLFGLFVVRRTGGRKVCVFFDVEYVYIYTFFFFFFFFFFFQVDKRIPRGFCLCNYSRAQVRAKAAIDFCSNYVSARFERERERRLKAFRIDRQLDVELYSFIVYHCCLCTSVRVYRCERMVHFVVVIESLDTSVSYRLCWYRFLTISMTNFKLICFKI